MNQKVKAEWVRRLRSGAIPQATRGLARKDNTGRCCLGVLCDIAVEQNAVQITGSRGDFLLYGVDEEINYLPYEVKIFAELDSEDPKISNINTLSNLNDRGATFNEIADLIEQNL